MELCNVAEEMITVCTPRTHKQIDALFGQITTFEEKNKTYQLAFKRREKPEGVIFPSGVANIQYHLILQTIEGIRHKLVLHKCSQNTEILKQKN